MKRTAKILGILVGIFLATTAVYVRSPILGGLMHAGGISLVAIVLVFWPNHD